MAKKNKGQNTTDDIDESATDANEIEGGDETEASDSETLLGHTGSVHLVSETEDEEAQPAGSIAIHSRLSDAVTAASTGPQDVCGPLNRVQILLGTLKTVLPDAIPVVQDESLKDDLTLLLGLL